ncbi:hypothetical protein [Umezawaea tangerina]|uniref:Uncharacterized protein n=1 Tax=Umezawaea tangerina TaxID=84725 RepID=A0A2T0TLW5_9PSEU|nr:hypothetical protein [Umezawaea tangerina]PRY46611.1 hypothetical protein CLV43_101889 [Umezawaea tangerina]
MEGVTAMSHQLNAALDDLGKAMKVLRDSTRQIPFRREGFRLVHHEFARSTAALRVAMSYARSQLEEPSVRRRRNRRR